MTVIGCHWACVSKQPRDSSDYRVLMCSAGHLAKYQALERPDRPGTPTTRAGGRVESLPWVTFGRNGDRDHQLTMSIMTWADHQDADGRPVTLTRFFLLPYAQLPDTAGYADLYRAAADVALPPEADTDLVHLTLPDAQPNARHRHDLSWAAATAAVLLESRVIITGLQDTRTERRLAAVDAVTRMLPRGYRADLTVASWVSYPAQRTQRLCFGPYAAGEFTEVRLDKNPVPRSAAARRYHMLLLKYLDRQEEHGLVEWLARYSTPLPFAADPSTALEILQELDLADAVVDELRAGRGRWKRVLRALDERGPTAFDDRGRYEIFQFGLAERGADAHTELGRYWSPLLRAAVVAAAHQASVPAERDRIASAFVPVAADHGDLDGYLTQLVTPGAALDPVPEEMFTVCLRALLDQPSAPSWPLLRQRLLDDVPSGVSLVIECQDPYPEKVPDLLSWLVEGHPSDIPAWLAVLHHIAAGDRLRAEPSPQLIEEAIRQNPSTALQALEIANRCATWEALGTALWQRLIAIAGRPPGDPSRQVLVSALNTLTTPIDAGPRARAFLDVLRQSCALPAANPPISTLALGSYVDGLADAIACVSAGHRIDVQRLLRQVTEMLAAQAPREDWDPVAEFLLTVLNRLPVAEPEDVADVVADILQRPGCAAALRALTTRGGEQWERLAAGSDRLRSLVPLLLFEEHALAHASSDELARCWAPIILAEHAGNARTGRPSIVALTGWPSLARVDALLNLLERTCAALVELDMPASEATQWRQDTIYQVARDRVLGEAAADALISSLRQEAARIAEANAHRLREIERQEAEQQQQIKILQDGLARLAAECAELADEDRRWEEFFISLSSNHKPKPEWAPAVQWDNDGTREPAGAKKGWLRW